WWSGRSRARLCRPERDNAKGQDAMSQETAPTQPQPGARTASAEKQALLEAYDSVLKHQVETREAEQREAEARRAARGRVRPWVWTSAACTMVLCAYLFIERPEW